MMESAAVRPRGTGTRYAGSLPCIAVAGALFLAPTGLAADNAAGATTEAPRPRLGFLAGSREAERKAELDMLAVPSPERERAWLRALTEEPHVAGTAQGKKVAEYVRDRLERGVLECIPFAAVNGAGAARVVNTTNIRFGELSAEALADRLDRAGVCVALGAACSAGSTEPSHVLGAMGLGRRAALASIRFSLSRYTTAAEIDRVLEVLPDIVRHPAVAA